MMRHPAALGQRGLRCSDVKAAIELRGIAGDYFAAELLGQPDAQR
jgi:hypothetical protein